MSCDVRKYNPLYNRFCFFWVIARWQKSGQQMNHSNPVSLPFTWRNLALPRSCFLIWTCASAWELRNTKCNCCAIWSGRFFFELCRLNLLNTDISSSHYPCHILSMLIWINTEMLSPNVLQKHALNMPCWAMLGRVTYESLKQLE